MKTKVLQETISFLFIVLFIYAATSKLFDYQTFRLQLEKSPFITSIAGFAAWSLPVAEIGTALLLLIPAARIAGLYASLFLMTLFTAYLVAMLGFSYYIPCSCGGILGGLSWKDHIVFNAFLMTLAIIGILLHKNFKYEKNKNPIGHIGIGPRPLP